MSSAFRAMFSINEQGYALPSVLFLVTILGVIAASIILHQYLSLNLAQREVAAVRAEFVAESGVAHALSTCASVSDLSHLIAGTENTYEFDDGRKAVVTTQQWGMFVLVKSHGMSGKVSVTRCALAADRPTGYFKNALVFANPQHQLVFTGTSRIRGDVVVGYPGATIGRIRGMPTPPSLPVDGTISKQNSFQLTASEAPQLVSLKNLHHSLLSMARGQEARLPGALFMSSLEGAQHGVTDSIEYVFVNQNTSIRDSLGRYQKPLFLIVDGSVLIQSGATLNGLVAVHASGIITVEQGVSIDGAVLVSSTAVDILADAQVSAQCIAPSIGIGDRVEGTYPTVVVSTPVDQESPQELSVGANARIEGVVAVLSSNRVPVRIAPSSKVIGCVYSDSPMTLDGSIVGSVVAKDFEFYDPPTQYFGWLRTATIDRQLLPVSFLMPPGFSSGIELDILDWL